MSYDRMRRGTCCDCGAPNSLDLLVVAGIVPPERTLCGDCKIKWGKLLIEGWLKHVAEKIA